MKLVLFLKNVSLFELATLQMLKLDEISGIDIEVLWPD